MLLEGMVSGLRFTRAEFDTMVDELLYKEEISFDTLCLIAEKTLRPSVINWCKNEECLCGRGFDDDIMQEIHLRLMKTTIDYFLLRDGIEGDYNDDPEGFEDWIFRVAENLKRDFANRIRNRDFKSENIDSAVEETVSDDHEDIREEYIERLKDAFRIVLSSDVGLYKILTWIAQFVFILNNNVTKIKSNELIIAAFENKTLNDMYDMILTASEKIPWIEVSEEQNEKILIALRKIRDNGVSYGDTKYKDFFMKHNGEASGKKSISDWVNRMNDMVRRTVERERFISEEKGKRIPSGIKKEKRRSGNGPSDN